MWGSQSPNMTPDRPLGAATGPGKTNVLRRMGRSELLRTVTATIAAMLATVIVAELVGLSLGAARSGGTRINTAGIRSTTTETGFGTLKRIDTVVLNCSQGPPSDRTGLARLLHDAGSPARHRP
jgi:hypothetical protein